ncbi:hypothetical protein F4782DRAFT_530757 [Xylaria castorea]|nr:hypothetical protein F4782DRAFT_530757 [Xylaria castorea]
MTDVSQVNWDGVKDLGETVSEQGHYRDGAAENGTKIHRRFCAIPLFIRVMFTPDKDHRRTFDDVQRFTVRAPSVGGSPEDWMEVLSNSTYLLRAIVKMDPQNPIENPAEVRLYDVNAVMTLADIRSKVKYRPVMGEKNRQDSEWSLGDPNLKFMLFYCVWEGDEYPTPLVPPVEYRPPRRIDHWEFPQRDLDIVSSSAGDSQHNN